MARFIRAQLAAGSSGTTHAGNESKKLIRGKQIRA
jgi:hypothetical protein